MLTDKQKDEIALEMTKIENLLTGEQDEFLELLDEFIWLLRGKGEES